jgi:hypothetical protein
MHQEQQNYDEGLLNQGINIEITCFYILYIDIPLGAPRVPQLALTRIKSHVYAPKNEVIPNFHNIFVVLQCFKKHPLSLQVAVPHFMHPNLVLRLF